MKLGSSWRGYAVLAISWALAIMPAAAREVLDLDAARAHAELHDWGDYLIDANGQLAAREVIRQPSGWQPTRSPSSYALAPGEVLWIRFTVPPAPDEQPWYVKLAQPGLDLVSLYTRMPDGGWTQQASGDTLAMSVWALPHRYPVLPLAVSAADPTYYLLRVQASEGLHVPVEFVSASRLSAEQQSHALAYGMYFGLLVMCGLFALATGAVLRDRAYIGLALWALVASLSAASAVGIAGLELWPMQPAWSDKAPYLLTVLAMPALVYFVAAALRLRDRAPRVHAGAWLATLAGLAMAAATGLSTGPTRYGLTVAAVAGLWALVIALMVWSWHRDDAFAGRLLLVLAPLPLALALQWSALSFAGLPAWVSDRLLVLAALGLGTPASFLLLALRSQELRQHQKRIAQLSEIDPTTGLINDTVFAQRMQGLIERAQRFRAPSLVALVDFPNLDQLRHEFGRKRSLEMLVRLAGRLTSIVRQVDTVSRVGADRFGLLVEGPLTTARARAFAAKVIAHCITPMAGLPQGMTARPRVALALVPEHGTEPRQVLQALDSLLRDPQDTAKGILIVDPDRLQGAPPAGAPATPPVAQDPVAVPAEAATDWLPTAGAEPQD